MKILKKEWYIFLNKNDSQEDIWSQDWMAYLFKSKSGPHLDGEEKNISIVALDSVSSTVIKKMS